MYVYIPWFGMRIYTVLKRKNSAGLIALKGEQEKKYIGRVRKRKNISERGLGGVNIYLSYCTQLI